MIREMFETSLVVLVILSNLFCAVIPKSVFCRLKNSKHNEKKLNNKTFGRVNKISIKLDIAIARIGARLPDNIKQMIDEKMNNIKCNLNSFDESQSNRNGRVNIIEYASISPHRPISQKLPILSPSQLLMPMSNQSDSE